MQENGGLCGIRDWQLTFSEPCSVLGAIQSSQGPWEGWVLFQLYRWKNGSLERLTHLESLSWETAELRLEPRSSWFQSRSAHSFDEELRLLVGALVAHDGRRPLWAGGTKTILPEQVTSVHGPGRMWGICRQSAQWLGGGIQKPHCSGLNPGSLFTSFVTLGK